MYSACRLNSPTNSFVVERFCCDVADYLNRFSFLTFRYNFVEMTKWTRKWFWSENLVQTWSSFSFSIFNPVGTKRCQISNGGKHQDAASGFLEVFLCGLKVLHFSNINPFLPSVICPPVVCFLMTSLKRTKSFSYDKQMPRRYLTPPPPVWFDADGAAFLLPNSLWWFNFAHPFKHQ